MSTRGDGTPGWEALEELLGDLEGGEGVCFSSGMAAIAAVLELLPVGARVVVPRTATPPAPCWRTAQWLVDGGGRASWT